MPMRAPLPVLAFLVLAPAAWAQPDPRLSYGQPPPRSHYADGTGDSDVDRLNAGQLDRNYRGPWHQVPPGREMIPPGRMMLGPMMPGPMPPGAMRPDAMSPVAMPPGAVFSGPMPLAPPPPGQF